jgi:large subunit ribosomal protein L1
VEFRIDKTSIINASIGKISFPEEKLVDNAKTFMAAVLHARPAVAKGRFVRSMFLSSTMGPSYKIVEDILEK